MARPKEFDRDDALRAGLGVFHRQGFAATTTDDLVKAMGIGRQSFYDTFGDKHECYVEALREYSRGLVAEQCSIVRGIRSPLDALGAFLGSAAEWSEERRSAGCMAVNAVAEFGDTDAAIAGAIAPSGMMLEESVVCLLREAKAAGEVPIDLDERTAAIALLCTRSGMAIGAKAGQAPAVLRHVAAFAIDRLRQR